MFNFLQINPVTQKSNFGTVWSTILNVIKILAYSKIGWFYYSHVVSTRNFVIVFYEFARSKKYTNRNGIRFRHYFGIWRTQFLSLYIILWTPICLTNSNNTINSNDTWTCVDEVVGRNAILTLIYIIHSMKVIQMQYLSKGVFGFIKGSSTQESYLLLLYVIKPNLTQCSQNLPFAIWNKSEAIKTHENFSKNTVSGCLVVIIMSLLNVSFHVYMENDKKE